MKIPNDTRKNYPAFSGFAAYFPDAMMAVANHSWKANEKHNPGERLHWNRDKSGDEIDALQRHIIDYAKGERYDEDGLSIACAIAWRAMGFLQKELEKEAEQESKIPEPIHISAKDMEFYKLIQEYISESNN